MLKPNELLLTLTRPNKVAGACRLKPRMPCQWHYLTQPGDKAISMLDEGMSLENGTYLHWKSSKSALRMSGHSLHFNEKIRTALDIETPNITEIFFHFSIVEVKRGMLYEWNGCGNSSGRSFSNTVVLGI